MGPLPNLTCRRADTSPRTDGMGSVINAVCSERLPGLRSCSLTTMAAVCLLILVLAAASARADQPSTTDLSRRIAVEDLRVALVQAIDAPDGQVHAVFVGKMAEAITSKFKAQSPIFVDVSTLKRYTQEGCRRLRLAIWQDGVVLPGSDGPQRRTVAFDLNYCRDGSPPASLS